MGESGVIEERHVPEDLFGAAAEMGLEAMVKDDVGRAALDLGAGLQVRLMAGFAPAVVNATRDVYKELVASGGIQLGAGELQDAALFGAADGIATRGTAFAAQFATSIAVEARGGAQRRVLADATREMLPDSLAKYMGDIVTLLKQAAESCGVRPLEPDETIKLMTEVWHRCRENVDAITNDFGERVAKEGRLVLQTSNSIN